MAATTPYSCNIRARSLKRCGRFSRRNSYRPALTTADFQPFCDLVVGEWGVTENGQRARYYRLTKDGRARLAAETAQWVRYAKTVTDILTSAPGPA
jgi:hypothetical protein